LIAERERGERVEERGGGHPADVRELARAVRANERHGVSPPKRALALDPAPPLGHHEDRRPIAPG
jgi:hypothetical protein